MRECIQTDNIHEIASRVLPAAALDIVPGLKIEDIVEPPSIAEVVDHVGPHPSITLLTQRCPPPWEIIAVHRPPEDDHVVVPKLPQSCGGIVQKSHPVVMDRARF